MQERWKWVQKGEIKMETDDMLMASSLHYLLTKLIQIKTETIFSDEKWQICKKKYETFHPIMTGCSKGAQKEYI